MRPLLSPPPADTEHFSCLQRLLSLRCRCVTGCVTAHTLCACLAISRQKRPIHSLWEATCDSQSLSVITAMLKPHISQCNQISPQPQDLSLLTKCSQVPHGCNFFFFLFFYSWKLVVDTCNRVTAGQAFSGTNSFVSTVVSVILVKRKKKNQGENPSAHYFLIFISFLSSLAHPSSFRDLSRGCTNTLHLGNCIQHAPVSTG